MTQTMKKAIFALFSAAFIASTASAQMVIAPAGCTLENARADNGSDGPWLEKSTALWWNSAGIISNATTIADGEPVPSVWPQHIYDWNAGAWAARVRDTGETPESPIGTAILTFSLGTIADVEGIVLWNHGEGTTTESDRGIETAGISWSTNGVDFINTGETLTFEKGPQISAPIDAQVQMLTSALSGVTHIRMACTNFIPAQAILGFSEIRMIGTRAPVLSYVATTPVDWNDATAWSDGNPVTAQREYRVDNGISLQTPALSEIFAGTSLTLAGSERLEIMTAGVDDAITVADLVLDTSELAAGVGSGNAAQINGNITVVSNSMFSGAMDDSRDLRILGRVLGGATDTVELSAPAHTIYLPNSGNTLSGTWIVSAGTAEFGNGGAVGSASINVQNGTLRILADWNGLANGDSLTVADSATAAVDVDSYNWIVTSLMIGSSNVLEGYAYTAAELSEMGDAVFTGSGTIQVGELLPPPYGDLIVGWDTWSSSTAPIASFMVSGINGTALTTTEQNAWNTTDERGASNDGSWGTHEGPPVASTNAVDGENLTLPNATTGGTITFTISNNGSEDYELGNFHFDAYAFRPKAPRSYELSVLEGSGISTGIVFTSENDAIKNVSGAWNNGAHEDIDISLVGLEDHILAAGETVQFLLSFSSGVGDNAGGHHLFVDNVGLSTAVDTGPPSPPLMMVEVSGSDVIVSWTSEATFKLQTKPQLLFGEWVDYPGGDSSPVTVPATEDAEFMRLLWQE